MNISKPKRIVICAVIVAALSQGCSSACEPVSDSVTTSINASIEETNDRVRVFIGDINRTPEGYTQQRSNYIKEIATADENKIMQAVIGLDDYYTVDAVDSWAKDYDITIDQVYMWPKGETGRMILSVDNNDIKASLESYKQQATEDGYCEDDDFAKEFQRLTNGEYKVFALTVTASAEALEVLDTEAECISYVDVMYNGEAEAYAKKVGKAISYVELPAKPDGAH